MKSNLLLLVLLSMGFSHCRNANLEALIDLDSQVRAHDTLFQFDSFKKTRKRINYIKVCNPENAHCRDGEEIYSLVLKKDKIPLNNFNELLDKMDKIGLRTYYRYKNYSLWVHGGAMGHINGYLINHDFSIKEIDPFELNKMYLIEVGNKISDNIYYFTGN